MIGQSVARLLIAAGGVHVSHDRPFILAAGWASPVYVDCRRLIGAPAAARAVTDLAVQAVAPLRDRFEVIAGAETAGIPFAAWLAERLERELCYVRKRPLGIGRNAQVEGAAVDGRRVLLFDDLATDGGSKVAFVRGLREAGAVVCDMMVIFFNGVFPGVRERLSALGLDLHAMAGWPDLLASGLLPQADQSLIETFLADPIAWSAKHGGRTAR